jgi:hypothetical protein
MARRALLHWEKINQGRGTLFARSADLAANGKTVEFEERKSD